MSKKNKQTQAPKNAEKVDDIKTGYQYSLTDLVALYGALSQQAFKSELDLSRVAPIAETGVAL
jgi:type I restriction enzyme S subunit